MYNIVSHVTISGISIPLSDTFNNIFKSDGIEKFDSELLMGHNNHNLLQHFTTNNTNVVKATNPLQYSVDTPVDAVCLGSCLVYANFTPDGFYSVKNNASSYKNVYGSDNLQNLRFVLSDNNFSYNDVFLQFNYYYKNGSSISYRNSTIENEVYINAVASVYRKTNISNLYGLYVMFFFRTGDDIIGVLNTTNFFVLNGNYQYDQYINTSQKIYKLIGRFDKTKLSGATPDDTNITFEYGRYSVSATFRDFLFNRINVKQVLALCNASGFYYCDGNLPTLSNLNDKLKIGYMDENRTIDVYRTLQGLSEIEKSGTYNKDLNKLPTWKDKPSDKDKIEPMEIGLNFTAGGMINYYRVTLEALNNLSAALSDPNIVPAGKDVLPNLISLKQFYVNKEKIINEAFPTEDEIIVAGVHTGVTGHKINSTFTYISLGDYLINGKFGSLENPDYLDFEPYTTIELYVPFCGWSTIPTACMYKPINVKLLYDIVTGTCMSVVSCDGLIVSQSAGVMCEDLPFKAENVGLKTANMINGIMGIAGSTAGMFSNAIAGNTGGLALSGGDVLSSITNAVITTNQNYTQIKGATGDSCIFGLPKKCYIKIQRPIIKEPENYKHEKGYPVMESFNLSEISGFTICENTDLSGLTCTEEEKQMLKNLLESGIYL